MNIDNNDDDDDLQPMESAVSQDTASPIEVDEPDDDLDNKPEVSEAVLETAEEEDDELSLAAEPSNDSPDYDGIQYDQSKIDLRGESLEHLQQLLYDDFELIGGSLLDARVREIGSWENLIVRSVEDRNAEQMRVQEALDKLEPHDRAALASVYRDSETNKIKLRTSALVSKNGVPGDRKTVSGEEALLAFENLKSTNGGGYRILLYNSGISVDVIIPTGNDLQTMITNCLLVDRELGSSQGAHYFTYADLLYKTQILNFIRPLIVNSSYVDWRKKGKLWSVIKFPDLNALVATIAALMYKDGFEGFVTRCTRPKSDEFPNQCHHTETFTANIFEMIVTRFAALSAPSIDWMVQARAHAARHTLAQIAKYQSELGFEGERISFGDLTFVMRIPTVAEYQEAGNDFISDVTNEIQGDNNDGQYQQFGFRYMRTFLPWIGSMEGKGPNGEILVTTDERAIIRSLEKLDHKDPDGKVRDALRDYINKIQLTYTGYPSLPCPACNYTADTPSGMLTFDPFAVFFTLALLYTSQTD